MNEVVPGLFVGDKDDCHSAPSTMAHLCVLQPSSKASLGCQGDGIQFVHELPNGDLHASAKALRRIARYIDAHLPNGPVLVHCAGGEERSPLAVTWYLGEWKGMGLESAWRLVSMKRPQSQDRRYWLR